MKKYFRIVYLNLEITDSPEKLALQNELSPPQDFTTKNTYEIRHDKLLRFQPSPSCGMFLYDCGFYLNPTKTKIRLQTLHWLVCIFL